ncbi:MAG: hypothetical protein JST00_18385 [Deltaproteobacteria bacterium]|nr:hypothetical protein [Deltaproteobacteria bacterium]
MRRVMVSLFVVALAASSQGCAGSAASIEPEESSEDAVTVRAMSAAEAKAAAAALGAELRQVRLLVEADLEAVAEGDLTTAYEASMAKHVGKASERPPRFSKKYGSLRAVSNWGAASPYPTIAVHLGNGRVYVHDGGRSTKWFGPYEPAANARITGTFDEETRQDLAVALSSSSIQ